MPLSAEDYTKLLSSFRDGNAKLAKALNQFYDSEQSEAVRNSLQLEVVAICNEILAAGDWHSSAFLQQMISPVEETKLTMLDSLGGGEAEQFDFGSMQPADMQEVFIAIYQSDGHNMAAWSLMMRSLPEFMLGRPVYADEESAVAFIRSKADRSTEAYVKAYIPKQAIMDDEGLVRRDRIGQTLLQIGHGALLVKNIRSFHHMGDSYIFNGKDLIKR
jgi:intracellular multiplication protein IcmQ